MIFSYENRHIKFWNGKVSWQRKTRGNANLFQYITKKKEKVRDFRSFGSVLFKQYMLKYNQCEIWQTYRICVYQTSERLKRRKQFKA